jgi:polysaccharide export outer membrane protein
MLSNPRSVTLLCCSAALLFGLANSRTADAREAASGLASQAQQETADNKTPPDPQLKLSPMEALRRFEPSADEEYTLGAGDEISIQYPGRAELGSKDVVGPDGRITLPLAGPIKIAGMSREEAAKTIAGALSAYYTNLTATVEVTKYGSNHVTLLGSVKNPGPINFDQVPTLLEVLSKGGIDNRPDGSIPEQCVIYRGDQVFWVDLQDLLSSGSPLADLRLRRNDVIFVPALSTRTVSVMGQVQHPGEIPLRHDSTLTSVIGEAGGLSDNAGNNPDIQIIHRSKGGNTQTIHFKDLMKPTGGLEISLNPGDVVYIPKSGMAKTGFILQQLAPFLTMGSIAAWAVR